MTKGGWRVGREQIFLWLNFTAMTDQLILLQLQQMPDHLKKEVMDFIGYLLQKHNFQAQNPRKGKKGAQRADKAEDQEPSPDSVIQVLKDDLDIEEMMREQHWQGADKAGVFQAIRSMNVQEPIEQLLGYLRA